MRFSVVVPAHNEERFITRCFNGIAAARARTPHPVEVIVCLNRCTDRTEVMAREFGATVVFEEAKCIAKIRNTGARAATGDVLITVDADSQMSVNTFLEIERKLSSGKFIGGGTKILPERWSLGIFLSLLIVMRYTLPSGVPSAGLFWCFKKDFDAINGFDESLATIEDLDFAIRLKAFGQRTGRRYGTLWRSHIITSCRKFDMFGDWYFVRNPKVVRALFEGRNKLAADRFYYEINR